MKPLFFSALLGLTAFLSIPGHAGTALPKGRDFPVTTIYEGHPAAHVDLKDAFTHQYRTRFKEAMQGPVVFAGEYAETGWGCGSSGCHLVAFINKRTGRALSETFMVYYSGTDDDQRSVGEEILYINKASRLLVTYESPEEPDQKYFYNYYLLEHGKLKLIRKVLDQSPQSHQ